jgi:predicted P-loop ATPase
MSKEDVVQWANEAFGADYPQTADIIRQCYAAQPDAFGRSAAVVKNIVEGGDREEGGRKKKKSEGSPYASVADIQNYLDRNIVVRTDGLTEQPQFRFVDEDDSQLRNLTDYYARSIWRRMAVDTGLRVNYRDIINIVRSDYAPICDPLVGYLKSLSAWTPDQPDYIAELAAMVVVDGGPKKQKLFLEYFRKWLVGMVAAWVDPNVVNQEVLILIGDQGVQKTVWCKYLLPPELQDYFSPMLGIKKVDNKDEVLKISQRALISFEEIDKFSEDVNTFLKALITVDKTDIRVAYGYFNEMRGHRASFCGSGNNPQFLSEAVSRRWLPFVAKSIADPRKFAYNYAGIYSQVYYLYQSGFRYWFDLDDIKRLAVHNRDFQETTMEEELIPLYFRKPGPDEVGQFFPNSLIMSYLPSSYRNQLSTVRIGKAMAALGFEQKRVKGRRGWICIPMTPSEMEAARKRLAMAENDPEDEDDDEQNDAESQNTEEESEEASEADGSDKDKPEDEAS